MEMVMVIVMVMVMAIVSVLDLLPVVDHQPEALRAVLLAEGARCGRQNKRGGRGGGHQLLPQKQHEKTKQFQRFDN
jgi:hypothetical protein